MWNDVVDPASQKKSKFEVAKKNLQLKWKEKNGSYIKKLRNKTYYVYSLKKNRAKRCNEIRYFLAGKTNISTSSNVMMRA